MLADPGLAAWAGDSRQVDRTWARAGDGIGDLAGFAFNEDGVALAFVARYDMSLGGIMTSDAGTDGRAGAGRWKRDNLRSIMHARLAATSARSDSSIPRQNL